MEVTYTLLSDGSSDRALIPFLNWMLEQHAPHNAVQAQWADFRYLKEPPVGLTNRIVAAVDLYPCDLLFVHRDAERIPLHERREEVLQTVAQLRADGFTLPVVCVIPVRMQEAWLLLDEIAIRAAVGNPRGRVPLPLPGPMQVENIADPKELLYNLLRVASGHKGRRLARLPVKNLRYRVAELMTNMGILRAVPAFSALETEVLQAVRENRWD